MIPNGWTRWMPGLRTLEHYQLAWLPHDIIAGLVLTTMLVPVGIAYAVASGVPGIYGLYATIVPLIAYALFGPSRIMVLGPDSSLAAIILGVIASAFGWRSHACRRTGGRNGHRVRNGMHPRWHSASRICHRTPVEADPLRLYERHRAHGTDQPVSKALRFLNRKSWASAEYLVDR